MKKKSYFNNATIHVEIESFFNEDGDTLEKLFEEIVIDYLNHSSFAEL